jgi:hydroxymethylbilane synthase
MAPDALRIGTRGSRLALWQTERVAGLLQQRHPGLLVEQVVVETVGDRVLDTALSKIGDKGLFTAELELALRERRIDIAVHSLKDLPTELPDDLALGAVLDREDPRDVLVSREGRQLHELAPGARVGSSSLRRRAQLLNAYPGLVAADLRGNVPTRLDKVARGEVEAAILARAGVRRLGLESHVTQVLEPWLMLPAPGQGALAIERRADDAATAERLAPLDDREARIATAAERGLLARLEGGCQVPVGALATRTPEGLRLEGLVADPDGRQVLRDVLEGAAPDPDAAARLGAALGERLLARGARAILAALRSDRPA